MTGRVPRHGEVTFTYWPDQPPSTREGEWRTRLGQVHFGAGPTIHAALDDMQAAIEQELDAVRRARASIAEKKP